MVRVLDLRYRGLSHAVAAFLVEGPDGAILVETGPASTLGALEEGLAAAGRPVEALDAVFVTHIHLDHAGAAGHLADRGLPVYVHPRGARHLVDPSRLLASAGRIYGDRLVPLWGETRPAPEKRIRVIEDGQEVAVAGLRIRAIDTPGHAGHHHAYRIGEDLFTGDAGGVRMPGGTLVAVPAVPPELDPVAWDASIDRLAAEDARRLFLTHFGAVDEPAAHLRLLRVALRDTLRGIVGASAEGLSRDEVEARFRARTRETARAAGVAEEDLARFEAANPASMSVDGVLRWAARHPIEAAAMVE